jgi:hypothetical protein
MKATTSLTITPDVEYGSQFRQILHARIHSRNLRPSHSVSVGSPRSGASETRRAGNKVQETRHSSRSKQVIRIRFEPQLRLLA